MTNRQKDEATKVRPQSSSPAASRRMQTTLQRDTPCERQLRSALHRMGLRFRIQWPVPGTRRRSDVAFPGVKIAVFVDGCFWHCCPVHATWPKSNRVWWQTKLAANVARDRETDRLLRCAGWQVIRFWEHEEMETAARTVARLVRKTTKARHLGLGNPEGVVRCLKALPSS
jgi:DNA mismatch endonuclease, patch repair protein